MKKRYGIGFLKFIEIISVSFRVDSANSRAIKFYLNRVIRESIYFICIEFVPKYTGMFTEMIYVSV